MRKWGACLILVSCLIGVPTIAGAPQKQVEVDGHIYRVVLKDGGASVYHKDWHPVITQTPAELQRRSRAAVLATGCTLKDSFWQGGAAVLAGTLECTAGIEPSVK